ncbi:TonB-dependent receptor [Lutibacter sp. B1]|uniref:TonB-dependent receptor n=1 Tax=Lutibacter sp. B1 TaxID=2725996 RepID=UPI001456E52B|nr:TonB-dependent receptor [Lutibacter sp. B1]NLP58449.1 TonB-dependent receptor [Lutibacter sp. B1]
MKKYVSILFIGFNLFVYSQNKISGTITNTKHEPLTDVVVYIEKLQKGTSTDENGYYELRNLPNSPIKITISYIGYKTHVKTINLQQNDEVIDFMLDEAVYKMDEVVISTPFNKLQSENAIKVELLKINDIAKSGSPTLIEAITNIPGVDMIAKGTGVTKPVIRGLSMTNILLLNNGVKMENFQFSENHPFIIDEFGIDHIEVIKGPASLLYGSDAVGGVINTVKERPAPEGKIIGDYNAQYHSNTEGFVTNLGVKGSSKDFYWGIRGGLKTHADYKDGNYKFVPNTRFEEYSLKTNIGLKKTFGVFNLYYDYNRPKLGMSVGDVIPLVTKKGREPKYWYQDLTSHLISSKNTLFLNDYKVDVNIAYQLNNRKLQTDDSKPFFEMTDMDLNTFSYEVKTHLPSTDKSEYLVGIQGANKTNRNNDAPNHVIPDADVDDFSVFGLAQYTFFDDLKTQAGIRYDYRSITTEAEADKEAIDEDYSNFSTSIGATYQMNENFLFRTNFASAYRTPNIAELTQDGMHGARYEQGNPELDSQRSYEIDLSVHFHSKNLMLDLSGFHNNINDYIFIAPTNETTESGDKIYKYAQTDAKIYGAEFITDCQPYEWLNLNLSYAYIVGKQNNDSRLPFIPQNKLRFNIKFTKEKIASLTNFYFKIGGLYASKQDNPAMFETETDSYFLLNSGIGTDVKWAKQLVSISIQVNNLLNEIYIDHLSTLKGMNYNNIGRNITATLKIPFDIK